MIHRSVHPNLDVEGCFPCKLASLLIAPSATGSTQAAEVTATEKRWEMDHAAYRRLVADGFQPKVLDGAAELEKRATREVEVTHGLGAPEEVKHLAP